MSNSPAFQYYPADLISDPEVMLWDMEQIGAYWQMITYLWLNEGKMDATLPNFYESLRKLFRKKTEKTAKSLWKKIEKKFVRNDGFITHKRIQKEIQRQAEWRLKSSEGGKKSAEKRKKDSKGGSIMVENNTQPKGNTLNLSSLNIKDITTIENNVKTKEEYTPITSGSSAMNRVFKKPTADEVSAYGREIGFEIDGEHFCSYYESKGWMIGKSRMRNWKAAVRTWKKRQGEFKGKIVKPKLKEFEYTKAGTVEVVE